MSRDKGRQYIILGAGGHAAVIADILYCRGDSLRGFLDDSIDVGTEVLGARVIGKLHDCDIYGDCVFIIGIGDNNKRKKIAEKYKFNYGLAIHPSAIVGHEVEIGCGTVVMAGSIINSRTVVGSHCIINTKASIDHDNSLGDYVHISPGATLGGTVQIGSVTHIGIGVCVKNNISVHDNVIVGAGAVVVSDIVEHGTYVGVPARRIK